MDFTGADNVNKTPDVSVYMLTYFHEKYISQAIESVLSQKTHYKFELVISDDCSKDGTVGILKEYEKKYPDVIRVNYNEENIGIPSNIYKARCMCRGRYITVLSGDDYWIRDDKIETEVGFLENHPEYVAVYNRIEFRMNDEQRAYELFPDKKKYVGREYSIRDYEKCRPLGAHGFVMRNFFLTEEGREYFGQARRISPFVDDAVDEVLILRKGNVYILDFTSDAHRVVDSDPSHNNYNSRYSRLEKFTHHINLLNGMSSEWHEEIDFVNWYAKFYTMGLVSMLFDRNKADYKKVFATIPVRYKKPFHRSIYIRVIPQLTAAVANRINRKLRS